MNVFLNIANKVIIYVSMLLVLITILALNTPIINNVFNINYEINEIILGLFIEYFLYLLILIFSIDFLIILKSLTYKFSYMDFLYFKYKVIHQNKTFFLIKQLLLLLIMTITIYHFESVSFIFIVCITYLITNNVIFYIKLIKPTLNQYTKIDSIKKFEELLIEKKYATKNINKEHILNILLIIIAYLFIIVEFNNSIINSEVMNTIMQKNDVIQCED